VATKAETHRAAHFRARLRESDRWVERAIIALYEQQTKDEQFQSETRHRNGVGFAANEASRGSYYARWILSGRKLSGIHLTRARKIACRHVLQLVRLSNASPEPEPEQPKELAENPFAMEEQFAAYEKEQEMKGFLSDPDYRSFLQES
jgi:hypothetical protein